MRNAFVPLSFVALTSACSVHSYVDGTASYTATPPVAGASGAAPLQAVMCLPNDDRKMTFRVGDRCVLSGPLRGAGKVNGGTALLSARGECDLPYANTVMPMRVETATFQLFGGAVDATLGGVIDGKYVTYRFTGSVGRDAPAETCEAMRGGAPLDPAPNPGMTSITPGHENWEIWTPEVALRK